MKIRNLFLAIAITATAFSAQAQNFEKGDKIVNLGIGLGSGGQGLPIFASFEKGIKDEIFGKGVLGVGAMGAFQSYEIAPVSATIITIGARASLHYPIIENEKLDTYAGLNIGLESVRTKIGTFKTSNSGLGWSSFIGARYAFTEKLSGMLELGYGISNLNIGVSIKL